MMMTLHGRMTEQRGMEVFPVMELTSPSEAGRVFGTKTEMDFIINYNIFISL